MRISIAVEPKSDQVESGPVLVGWFINKAFSSVLFDPPRRVRTPDVICDHAHSASRCPAVNNLESRYFEVPCPYDLNLGFFRDAKGKPCLRNLLGKKSPMRESAIWKTVKLVAESEWRHPDRPTIQLAVPYTFVADEPVYMVQLAPFLHYSQQPIPGTIFGGRFPIDIWVRTVSWAMEWHDIEKPLILRRGEPLFYCQFESTRPQQPVKLIEAELTPELQAYHNDLVGVVQYVKQTFSLFEAAERLRPKKLLTPMKRD